MKNKTQSTSETVVVRGTGYETGDVHYLVFQPSTNKWLQFTMSDIRVLEDLGVVILWNPSRVA